MNAQTKTGNPLLEVLRVRNYTLLWLGQSTSLLGDNFHFIALSWLVLQLTGDPFALGTVLALGGVPRAIFMLVGGAVTDRFSPRNIMLISDVIRLGLSALLMVLVLTGTVNLWTLYALAIAFGFVGGFFQPAAGAIMPSLVSGEQLQPANAIFGGSAQLLSFIGPVLAGGVIALFSGSSSGTAAMTGIVIAFGVDALSFLVSVITLWFMRVPVAPTVTSGAQTETVLESIRAGLGYMWHDPVSRWMLVVISSVNLFILGPVAVGIPVLARIRLPEGVAAYGIVIGAYGAGNLLGTILSGSMQVKKGLGWQTIVLITSFGLGFGVFGWVTSTWVAFTILLLLGIGNGYFEIVLITLLQKRTPPEMMGRVMSLVMLASVGLAPISQALAGAIVTISLEGLFALAGGLTLLVAVWTAFAPALRLFDSEVEQLNQVRAN